MLLQDKVAVVTGAGAGLGRAVALHFAAEGASVIAVSLYPHELAEVSETAERSGLTVSTVAADVSDAQRTAEVARDVLDRHGHVDVLVNNAAIIVVKPIEETSVEEWDRLLAVNLRGAFLYCKAFVPAMKARHDGVIINVSSQSGVKGFAGEVAYCPSKFGLEGLTYTLALELASWNIRVLAVHPGIGMRTPMSMTTYDEEARKTWRNPVEIAPGFAYLAAQHDPTLSGQRFNAWEMAQRALRMGVGHEHGA
jgi:NAD(P)-dependent dehydrogenase (short-subunit alcohol dehydrogenase family)